MRSRIAILAALLVVGALVTAPPSLGAQAAVIRVATTTPQVEAGTGVARFVATGLPSGPATLQWFDPVRKAWTKAGAVARKGTRGTATATGLPAGINKFRIVVAGRKSTVMDVRTFGLFDSTSQTSLVGSTVFPMETVSGVQKSWSWGPEKACDYINLGMGVVSGNYSGWYLEALVQSEALGPQTFRLDTGTDFVQKEIPVAGVTQISFAQRSTSINRFGLQAHCLFSPF